MKIFLELRPAGAARVEAVIRSSPRLTPSRFGRQVVDAGVLDVPLEQALDLAQRALLGHWPGM